MSIFRCNAEVLTGLTGYYRSGQVFLTWQNVSNTSTYYKVYRSTSPITSSDQLATIEYLGYTNSYSAMDISLSAQDSTPRYLRLDSAGAMLPSTAGLFVATTLVSSDYYYAVTTLYCGVEDKTIIPGGNSLQTAISEIVNTPAPIYQEWRLVGKDTVEIYSTFMSSKFAVDSPLLNNAGFMDFDFAVARNHPDGTLRPMRVRFHGGGALFLDRIVNFDDNEINFNVEDVLPSGEKTGFWGTNVNFDIYVDANNNPPKTGLNYNHTQTRILQAIDWAIKHLDVDSNRIYIEATSMGSPGAYFMAITYPDKFAAINLSVGCFNFAFDKDYQTNCSLNTNKSNRKKGDDRLGKITTDLNCNLSKGTYEAMNGGWMIHKNQNLDYPFIYSINGRKDKTMGWTEKTFYYDSVNHNFLGGWYFYDNRAHNGTNAYWAGNNFDMFRFNKIISYPAVSSCSLNENWGNGDGASGDSVGTVNGTIDWQNPSADDSMNWKLKLFIRDLQTSNNGAKKYPDSCTATITPRRLQKFHPANGETVYWSLMHKGQLIQSGSIIKGSGIMVFPAIKIFKDSVEFALSRNQITYYIDADGDGYGNPYISESAVIQPQGFVLNEEDCNDADENISPAAAEKCNSIDDNCNNQIDEGVTFTTYYIDEDGDGYGSNEFIVSCLTLDTDGYALNNLDCNDFNSGINPGVNEICNSIDDNCNNQVDDGLPLYNYYMDADGDGFGSTEFITSCNNIVSIGYSVNNSDCNDSDAAINPNALDICNNIDDNCNLLIDEDGSILATITPDGTVSACKNVKLLLSASTGTGYVYQWMKDGVNVAGATNSTYTTTGGESGSFTVLISNDGVCATTSSPTVIIRLSKPSATITPLGNLDICGVGTVDLQASSGVGYTYKWLLNNVKISGATNQLYAATSSGSYTVKVTDANGCTKKSSAVNVYSSCKSSDVTVLSIEQISVFPNPNNGKFLIHIDPLPGNELATIQIKNLVGQAVFKEIFICGNEDKEIIMPEQIPSGIYLLEIKIADRSFSSLINVSKK